MRIISGTLKGRTFRVPPGFPSRPTTDFAKEGLFNILENSFNFEHMNVLDLFAGTGNLSFEFLSRGASSITAVDKNHRVCTFLQKNAQILKLVAQLTVVNSDSLQFLERTAATFDMIVADPPFDLTIHHSITDVVFRRHLLKPDGMLIIEHGKLTNMENATNFSKTRNFGNVNFSFFTWP
jgi:16S rRNA (guanine(966)-N(2))-methyltransferase RsmD